MATKTIRIGSAENIFQYDDGDEDSAVETDHIIKAEGFESTGGGGGSGASGTFTVITAIQVGGAGAIGFQYRTRSLTFVTGLITTIGAESGWNDV
jgi:hypothetical protein